MMKIRIRFMMKATMKAVLTLAMIYAVGMVVAGGWILMEKTSLYGSILLGLVTAVILTIAVLSITGMWKQN